MCVCGEEGGFKNDKSLMLDYVRGEHTNENTLTPSNKSMGHHLLEYFIHLQSSYFQKGCSRKCVGSETGNELVLKGSQNGSMM